MRYLLSMILAGGMLLASLWGGGSLLYSLARVQHFDRVVGTLPSEWTQTLLASALNRLNLSLQLSPACAETWYDRGRLLEAYRHLAPAAWQPMPWEPDLICALSLSPASPLPLLKLAMACTVGAPSLFGQDTGRCGPLFQALLARDPNYGYAHFRYAEYLYTRALAQPARREELAGQVCREYGLALSGMSVSHLVRDHHLQRAYYNCTNLANTFQAARRLEPSDPAQWELLGRGLGRKSDSAWKEIGQAVIQDLQTRNASVADYAALAKGLAKAARPLEGARVLESFTATHPDVSQGWEELLRYLTVNWRWFAREDSVRVLREAQGRARLALAPGLYFLARSCQLNERALAWSFFNKLYQLEPNNSEIYAAIARCNLAWGQHPAAVAYCQKALILQPNSAALHVELGKVYVAMKEFKKAMDQFQQALDLDPTDRHAKEAIKAMGIY